MKRHNIRGVLLILAIGGAHVYAANIAIEPYLQVLTNDSIKVVWWTDSQTSRNVVHIVNPVHTTVSATSRQIHAVTFVRHSATVTKLKPATDYQYYVESDSARSLRCLRRIDARNANMALSQTASISFDVRRGLLPVPKRDIALLT